MEQTADHQNLKTLRQFSKYQFLKKITQLLLSVSVFSYLLSNSNHFSFLHSFFSHTINKNCIFLLCNGLLVFVAKFSGLIASSSPSSSKNSYNNTESIKNYEEFEALPLVMESKMTLLEKEANVNGIIHQELNMEDKVNQESENEFLIIEKESENGFLIIEKESEDFLEKDDDKEFDDKSLVLDQDQEQQQKEEYENEDEENGMLSTEELNKKFEEFIRKMKEGIRIEAQQQLVTVN